MACRKKIISGNQILLTSLAPSSHWVWVIWNLNMKRASEMSTIFESQKLFSRKYVNFGQKKLPRLRIRSVWNWRKKLPNSKFGWSTFQRTKHMRCALDLQLMVINSAFVNLYFVLYKLVVFNSCIINFWKTVAPFSGLKSPTGQIIFDDLGFYSK